MALAHSKLTAQGWISIPAKIRRRLGIGPGSVVEWDEEGDSIVVRKAGRYSSEDIHRALFPSSPEPRSLDELKDGLRRHIKKRSAPLIPMCYRLAMLPNHRQLTMQDSEAASAWDEQF